MIIAIPKETLFEFLKKNETVNSFASILMAKDRAALAEYADEYSCISGYIDLDNYVVVEIKELPI